MDLFSFLKLGDKRVLASTEEILAEARGNTPSQPPQQPPQPAGSETRPQINLGQTTNAQMASPAAPKRKDSGNQWTELAVGSYLANPRIQNKQDIIDSPIPHNQIARRDGFLQDLTTASDQDVKKYIDGMRNGIGNRFKDVDPRQVFVRANNNELAPSNIRNQIGQLGTGEHKADVLFQDGQGQNHGLGVKKSKDATLTNYSIESLLDSVFEDVSETGELDDDAKPYGEELKEIRQQMYFDEGVPHTAAEFRDLYPEARKSGGGLDFNHPSVPSNLRERYGKLFIPDENNYHSKFRDLFTQNPEAFMRKYYEKLFKSHLPYQLSNFNGSELQEFSKEGLIGPGEVNVQTSKNPGARGENDAAKQFFTMFHDGTPRYRLESRHKGDPFSSQQLFTQNPAKGHTHRPYT